MIGNPIRTASRTVATAALLLAISIAGSAVRGAEVPFTLVTVDEQPPARPYYKMVGDVSGDGFPDVVVGGAKGPLVCYAYPDWAKTQIAEGGWRGVKGAIGDVDNDGDADVVMGGVVWFRNPGIAGGSWEMIRIDRRTAHDVELGDLDGDGRPDVAARDQSAFGGSGNAIYLYRQANPTSWSKRTIACPHGEGLKLGDLDRDGDPDVVIGGRWYENGGTAAGPWTEHRYTTAWTEPDAKVEMADLNGDGRPDVVLTPAELRGETYKVAWYEAPADPRKGDWAEHVIVPEIEAVIHSLGVGDFDGDGHTDVAIAEMHQGADPDEVSVHLNRSRGTAWQKQVLSTRGSHDIVVADVDRDGDPDVVGANHAGAQHPLELWRNDR